MALSSEHFASIGFVMNYSPEIFAVLLSILSVNITDALANYIVYDLF